MPQRNLADCTIFESLDISPRGALKKEETVL